MNFSRTEVKIGQFTFIADVLHHPHSIVVTDAEGPIRSVVIRDPLAGPVYLLMVELQSAREWLKRLLTATVK